MAHTLKGKKKLLTRVRRIKGQTEALEKALENETGCSAILQQISAIRGAVNGLMVEVLNGHITDHLGNENTTIEQKKEDIEQITEILQSYLR
ncbi:MAG: metal/formaldehyde-sensitive transcriptional repressor [Zymomonas mobilis subsp. pomaceae]|uniref:DNA-binding FrmR family transcriptional regulator n=1 Tax=Zymomonas mobilis subsp. pomaceae (strain ATCC 29192 / DSM 22645 / JCM 10191 / CCUG 17912 / NBRC 13757 / NCIMB 11200 / NRRL B-4491 / Barker I) TaxID=579138 RepID=F8ETG3_ZYMMT|nr:metal/formaldehyde-sensitive transcriptional repressor [Zymomonas mobilis]AEI37988.1 protein of unknown function DUF156 [Zymomonas mobilis subsp. pomaceae ATCC 29192]MDX5949356.1 metal/formaldehyde-sensitive transcriptional repressor [Zymomonas mobilis subsp. pomaceae]GEB89912.1 hypothetical protein ZMO02_15490 [Zymomonas mobilis subsp. pomaceae]